MAWGIMPELKEPNVCDAPCQHKDCAEIRRMVGSPCAICGNPVEAGQKYQFADDAGWPNKSGVQHFVCAVEKAEAR